MSGFVVAVTYGTRRNQVYANCPDMRNAKVMREAAREHGYKDAKIVDEETFNRQLAASRRSEAD